MGIEEIKKQFLKDYREEYPEALTVRYDMLECLSHGEGQETILAEERDSGRKVIIKYYDQKNPLFYLTEQDSLHNLNHPGVPAFLEEYRDETGRYIIREYIAGRTLMDYGREHHFEEREIIGLGIELCDILQYLHAQKPPVIHRDIKPQNIVLKEDGGICLIDFGISRLFRETDGTDTVFCGTKDYAAPEQYGYMQTGVYSDIFSLGIVLTWMLTQKAAPIQRPETALEKILAGCTAFAPENRYQEAAGLKKALQALPEDGRTKTVRRGKAVYGFVLTCFLVLAGLGGIIGYYSGGRIKEPLIEEAVRLTLKKPRGALTKQDLQSIMEVYIVGDGVYASREECFAARDRWHTEGERRGPVMSVKDLEKLPNLETVHIFGEHIEDLSPLENLSRLKELELGFNDIADISVLAGKPQLSFLGLSNCPLQDISVLGECPMLDSVDLRNTGSSYTSEVFAQMGDFRIMDIDNGSDAYRYLGNKKIYTLKLGGPELKDLECIRDTTVGELYIDYSGIADIGALEGRGDIVYLSMEGCLVDDLSVLSTMPGLYQVVLSANMRNAIETACKDPDFMIEYRE